MATLAERRGKLLESISPRYSGRVHFAALNLIGLGLAGGLLSFLGPLQTWEWLFIPGFLLFFNFFEWSAHWGPMHHRIPIFAGTYRRHSLEHHIVFTHDSMDLRSARELAHVIFPPTSSMALLVLITLHAVPLGWLISTNVGLLFAALAVLYYLAYEWSHLLTHWPADSFLGRRALITYLRDHHGTHHHLSIMDDINFNVVCPFADWVMGTRDPRRPADLSPAPPRSSPM